MGHFNNILRMLVRLPTRMLIAKKKRAVESMSLIKPSVLLAGEVVLSKDKANKLSQISLLDDTVKGRIDELFQNIKDQLLDPTKKSPFFAVQCDETTDTANCSQLLLYVRTMSDNLEKEELLLCHPMEGRVTSADIFNVVSNLFEENQLSWKSMVGVCTDRTLAISGLRSGFI